MINTDVSSVTYNTAEGQAIYSIPFPFNEDLESGTPELSVTLDGVELQYNGTGENGYTITPDGLQLAGTVAANKALVIKRKIRFVQDYLFQVGLIDAKQIEAAFDDSVMRDQQLSQEIKDLDFAISEEIEALKQKDQDILEEVGLKANKEDVYTKTETDNKLSQKANSADVYNKETIDSKLSSKAEVSNTYTKADVDSKLAQKANKSTSLAGYGIEDSYTKEDVDDKLAQKADSNSVYDKGTIDSKFDAKADKSDTYTKTEVDTVVNQKIAGVYKVKGSVESYNDLPSSGQQTGDVWNVLDTGANYVWTGDAWDKLSETVDLSLYLKKEEAINTYATKDELAKKQDSLPDISSNQGKFLKSNGETVEWANALENNSSVTEALAIGPGASAKALGAVAIGAHAEATGTHSIQLGHHGVNSEPKTFKVSLGEEEAENYTLLGSSGRVPSERLASGGTKGQVLTKAENGLEWADVSGGSQEVPRPYYVDFIWNDSESNTTPIPAVEMSTDLADGEYNFYIDVLELIKNEWFGYKTYNIVFIKKNGEITEVDCRLVWGALPRFLNVESAFYSRGDIEHYTMQSGKSCFALWGLGSDAPTYQQRDFEKIFKCSDLYDKGGNVINGISLSIFSEDPEDPIVAANSFQFKPYFETYNFGDYSSATIDLDTNAIILENMTNGADNLGAIIYISDHSVSNYIAAEVIWYKVGNLVTLGFRITEAIGIFKDAVFVFTNNQKVAIMKKDGAPFGASISLDSTINYLGGSNAAVYLNYSNQETISFVGFNTAGVSETEIDDKIQSAIGTIETALAEV